MTPTELSAHEFGQLAIWKTQLPNAKHAVLPPTNNRPNPLVVEGTVYASVFSEGAVCALDRKSGALLWRKENPRLGSSAVHFTEATLFAKTAQTLFALEPQTGDTIWSFCPYGESGEWIYSNPTVHGSRLFIGDRRGYIHCLDSRSGKTLWEQLTSGDEKRDVNSTPVIVDDLVIVGTNASLAAAYDVKTGRQVWSQGLDGPSVIGPLLLDDFVVLITDSVYFLKASDGQIASKFSWPGDRVRTADCTPNDIVCVLQGPWPPKEVATLVSLDERGVRYTKTLAAYGGHIHCVRETETIYISHFRGIEALSQVDGATKFKIGLEDVDGEIGPVDVRDDAIFALTGDGRVYALRHPCAPQKFRAEASDSGIEVKIGHLFDAARRGILRSHVRIQGVVPLPFRPAPASPMMPSGSYFWGPGQARH
jgi:outer membrane protein assembly factor BamB